MAPLHPVAEHQPPPPTAAAAATTAGSASADTETTSNTLTVPSIRSHKNKKSVHHHRQQAGGAIRLAPQGSKILRNIAQAKHTKRFPHTNSLAGAFDNMRTKETNALRKRRRFLRALRRHRNALKHQRSSPNITSKAGANVFPNIEAASSGTTLPAGSVGPSASGTVLLPLFGSNTNGSSSPVVDRVRVFVRLRPSTEFANANFYIAPNSNNIEVFRVRGDRRQQAKNSRQIRNASCNKKFRPNLLDFNADKSPQQTLFGGGRKTSSPSTGQAESDAFADPNVITAQHDPSKKVFNWRFNFDGIIHDMYMHASKSLANLAQQQTQLHTFELVGKPLVQAALRGTNGVMLSCGHAKTGKSYSLVGNLNSYDFRGVIPRALQYLFQQLQAQTTVAASQQQQARIYMQYYDVYGDHLVDLLSPTPTTAAPVKQHNMTLLKLHNLLYVHEMRLHQVAREEDALKIFMIGESFRQSCRQQQRRQNKRFPVNEKKSANSKNDENPAEHESVDDYARSHTIFTVYIEQRLLLPQQQQQQQQQQAQRANNAAQQQAGAAAVDNTAIIDDRIVCAKICFVELAAPHRLPKHSFVDPNRRTEISEINKSLSFLEHSILMLSESQPLLTHPPVQQPPISMPPIVPPPTPATTKEPFAQQLNQISTKQSTMKQRPATAKAETPTTTAMPTINALQQLQQQPPNVQQKQQPVQLPQPLQQQIPSRTCKLTYALKDLLNTKTYCIILAHICGQRSKLNDTLATLNFASRMKLVPICPMRTRRIDRRRRMRKLEAEVEQLTKDLRMFSLLQQQPIDPTAHSAEDDLTPEEFQRLRREANEYLKGNPSRLDSPTFRSSFKQMRAFLACMQRSIRNAILQQQSSAAQQQQQLQQQQQQLLAAAVSPLEASNTASTVIEPTSATAPVTTTHAETRRERRAKAAAGGDKQQALSVSEVDRQHERVVSPAAGSTTREQQQHADRPTINSSAVTTDDETSSVLADEADETNTTRLPTSSNKQRLGIGGNNSASAKTPGDNQSVSGASTSGKQQQQAALQSSAAARKGNQPAASGRKGTANAGAHSTSAKEIQAAAAAAAATAAANSATAGEAGFGKSQSSSHATGGEAATAGQGGGSEASSDEDHKLHAQRMSAGGEGAGGLRADGDLSLGQGAGVGGAGSASELPSKSDAYYVFIRSTPHGTLIYQTLVQNKKVVHEKEERIKENSIYIGSCKERIRGVQKRLRLCERVWKADKKQKLAVAAEEKKEKTPSQKKSVTTTVAAPTDKKQSNDTVTDGCLVVEERDYDDVRLLIQLQKELSEKKEMLDRLKREFHAAIDFVSRTRLFLMRQFVEWYETTYANAVDKRVGSPTAAIPTNASVAGGVLSPAGANTAGAQAVSETATVENAQDNTEYTALERDPLAAAFFRARSVAGKWSDAQAVSNKWNKIDSHRDSPTCARHQAAWK